MKSLLLMGLLFTGVVSAGSNECMTNLNNDLKVALERTVEESSADLKIMNFLFSGSESVKETSHVSYLITVEEDGATINRVGIIKLEDKCKLPQVHLRYGLNSSEVKNKLK